MDVESLRSRLDSTGQSHLFQLWDSLSDPDKQSLYNELNHMNFTEINSLFETAMQSLKHGSNKIDNMLEPLPAEVCGSVTRTDTETISQYNTKGLQAIGNNEVAVLLLAGGQGTRLGVNYPKGMYNVGLPSRKTLYQLQAESILKVQQNAQRQTGKPCVVPWYIMTSEYTKEATRTFFEKHSYFGLESENVILFEQNLLPCIGFDGKLFLVNQHKVAMAPDGNGGLYKALRSSKVLSDMETRGIQYLHVYCVDNILVKVADPVLLGFCINKRANCGAKVVEKSFPTEGVGVVCKVEGKYQVVNYTDITLKAAEKRNQDGRLVLNAGTICNHFFTMEFLKMVVDPANESELKYHVSKKKIPYVNSAGESIRPTEPNGIKLEKFAFDVFQFATAIDQVELNFVVWEIIREDEFSALKNADGESKDTPTTCRQDLCSLHRRFVLRAAGKFVHKDGSDILPIPSDRTCEEVNDLVVEISPLITYAGEDLEGIVSGKSFIPPVSFEMDKDGTVTVQQGS